MTTPRTKKTDSKSTTPTKKTSAAKEHATPKKAKSEVAATATSAKKVQSAAVSTKKKDHAPEFVVTKKHANKTLEWQVGGCLRVELPENPNQGLQWQLLKLPHGITLETSQTTAHQALHHHSLATQDRIFRFAIEEAGDYSLQFQLARPFNQSGYADSFKVKLHAKEGENTTSNG